MYMWLCLQMNDERNYHIFYCMLAGLSAEEKKQLDVKDATDYFYLIQVRSYLYLVLSFLFLSA